MQKNITTITYGIWLIEPGGFLARLVRVMEEELKPKAWCWCLLLLTITTSTVMVVRPVTMSVVGRPRKRPISLPVVRVRVEVSPALLILDHILGGGRSCGFLRTLPALPPWLLTALVLGSSLLEECYEDLLHWLAHCSKNWIFESNLVFLEPLVNPRMWLWLFHLRLRPPYWVAAVSLQFQSEES